MTPDQIATLQRSSALGWVALSGFVNEKQTLIEFKDHRFMIDIYNDRHPDVVCIKSAQVGFSVYAILSSFHELMFEKRNILYALPTKNVVNDFVVPKVNPLITSNPMIAKQMAGDSVSLKKLGERFIFFKGGSEREAISVSADTLIIDEYDKMPDMNVVSMFDSRLQAAKEPRRKRFSNPTGIGFGIDALYQDSNQFHWFVTCHHCGHDYYLEYERQGKSHYVDKERLIYACGGCEEELSDSDRRNGRWVARFKDRTKRHGYWISQMMAPWVTAERIVQQEQEMDIGTFNSMVLGKAYTPSDMVVNRQTILRACVPSVIPKVGVAMGVDQKASEMEWVAGTSRGVFAYGRAKSWEEIEHLKLQWNAYTVADGRPYMTGPKLLAEKYKDFMVALGKPFNTLDVLDWTKPNTVFYDRVKILDIVAKEITEARLLFRMHPNELEDYIADWQNIYRTTVEEADGRSKSDWLKKDNKESDFPFATAYYRIALSQVMGSSGGMLIEAAGMNNTPITDEARNDESVVLETLSEAIRDTFAEMD